MNHEIIAKELINIGNSALAKHEIKFFKTGKGEYGEGDKFLGITTPSVRAIIQPYWKAIPLEDISILLGSEWHNIRLAALLIMIKRMNSESDEIYKIFVNNVAHINNWDLVDVSTPHIAGKYWCEKKDYSMLWEYANSKSLWTERISVVSQLYNIRKYGDTALTMSLAEHFIDHKHDLMHKATGWLLREAGKKDSDVLLHFLDTHAAYMPRTMLRYSIEKLSADDKTHYMKMKRA